MTAVPALHGSRFHQPSRTAGTAPSTRQTITLHTATALPDLASELVRHVAAPAFAAPPWHDTPADIDTLCRRLLHDGRRSGFRFAWAQNHG